MAARHAVFGVLGLAALLVVLEVRSVLQSERGGAVHERDEPGRDPGARGSARLAAPATAREEDAAEGRTGAFWPARFAWGSGPRALGREARAEGNAEGPAAIAVTADGALLVLDTVNARLVVADGRGARSLPSPLAAPFDVAALPGGKVALLDRLVDRAFAIVDATGKVLVRAPLPGRVGDPGLLTGVFATGDAVCLEREHGACVPVTRTNGEPLRAEDETDLAGRPASDGKSLLHAGIVAPPSARVHLTRSRARPFAHGYTRELAMPSTVRSLDFLDANDAGELYLALTLEGAPDEHLVLCLATETGVEVARQRVPASPLPDEVNRAFAVEPGGGFAYLYRTVDGAEPRRYPCGP
jgi:hypothetical protein